MCINTLVTHLRKAQCKQHKSHENCEEVQYSKEKIPSNKNCSCHGSGGVAHKTGEDAVAG